MREIVFKSITSPLSKKRDLCVQEIVEREGLRIMTEKRCLYFVIGKVHVDAPCDHTRLAHADDHTLPHKKSHLYMLKIRDTVHGVDRLLYKAAGSFYATYGNEIYCLAYVVSLKITFLNMLIQGGSTHAESSYS